MRESDKGRVQGGHAADGPSHQVGIEVGRGCVRLDGVAVGVTEPSGVAHEHCSSIGVEHGHVMFGMSGSVEHTQRRALADRHGVALGEFDDAIGRHRPHLAPHDAELGFTVDASGR